MVPVVFDQTLYFYCLPGNNMYVPGDCNILLISACDLCCRKKLVDESIEFHGFCILVDHTESNK